MRTKTEVMSATASKLVQVPSARDIDSGYLADYRAQRNRAACSQEMAATQLAALSSSNSADPFSFSKLLPRSRSSLSASILLPSQPHSPSPPCILYPPLSQPSPSQISPSAMLSYQPNTISPYSNALALTLSSPMYLSGRSPSTVVPFNSSTPFIPSYNSSPLFRLSPSPAPLLSKADR